MRDNRSDRSARVLIFNYSGYPDYTSYFLIDNGLAYLAAMLHAAGHFAVVRDYVTVDTAERLHTDALSGRIVPLRARVRDEILQQGSIAEDTMRRVADAEAEVRESNARVARQIARELAEELSEGFDVLAVKLWSQPALRDVEAILRHVRSACPNLKIIAGGGHIDYFLDRVLRTIPALDAAALGDGEVALMGFADWAVGRIRDLSAVPNMLYRDGTSIRTTAVSESEAFIRSEVYPNFDGEIYPAASDHELKMLTIPFEDSRGCQFSCGFCAHPIKSGSRMRRRDVESIVSELAWLNGRYGYVNFTGSGSNTSFKHASDVYQHLLDAGLDLAVNFFQSLRDFRPEKASAMSQSHIPLLWVGIESGDQDLLATTYNKRRNMRRTREVCEFLNEHSIGYIMSMIYPSLGETEDSARATAEFVREVGWGHIVLYAPLLQPRTPWMHDEHVRWLDQDLYLQESQYGLEEVENFVVPPMVSSEAINESVLINGVTYRELYCQHVRFADRLDQICGGERGRKRPIQFKPGLAPFMETLNDTFWRVDQALSDGEFASARGAMRKFNALATAGSIAATVPIARSFREDLRRDRTRQVRVQTGGPA